MNFVALLSYAIIACLSPGPNAIFSMSNASRYPLKKSIGFNVGIAIGALLVLVFCSAFSVVVLRLLPQLQPVLIWAGAGYILWLAWQMLHSGPMGEQSTSSQRTLFWQGFWLQFMNPITILYGLSVFSTFIVPFYQSPVILLLFCLLLAVIAFLTTACWTLFGSMFKRYLQQHQTLANGIMAALLAYCAVSLVV